MATLLLLAEDDDALRAMLSEALRENGHDVIECKNEDEWSAALDTDRIWDVLVTDVEMPGSHNGLELARRARNKQPDLPLIIMSGKRQCEFAHMPRDAEFLPKPFGLCELLRHVDRAAPAGRIEDHEVPASPASSGQRLGNH